MDLGPRQGGVNELARIVDIHQMEDLYLAHRDVHLHLGKAAAKGKGIVLTLVGILGGDVDRAAEGVKGLLGNLLQGAQNLPGGGVAHRPVLDGQPLRRAVQHLGGVVQQLLAELQSHLLDGHAGDVGLPGGIGPGVKGGNVGILEGDDVYILGGDADGFGGHLAKDRIAALADLGGPHRELHRAVLVEDDTGRGCFQGNRPHAGFVDKDRHAHPPAYWSGLVLIRPAQLVPADEGRPLFHTRLESGAVAGDAVGGVHIALGHEVFEPECIGVPAHGVGDVLHEALGGPGPLRDAVGPHGAGGGQVSIDGISLRLMAQNIGIDLPEAVDRVCHDGVAVGGVGALVGHRPAGPGHQAHIIVHRRFHVEVLRMAGAGISKGLLPGELQLHRPASHLGGEVGVEGLVEHLLLVAKTAADVGLDDPDLAPGDAQGLAHHPADDVGDLGGGHHGNAAVLHIGVGDGVFNVAVLDLLGVVMPFKAVEFGGGQHLLHGGKLRAVLGGQIGDGVLEHIVGAFLVDGGDAGRHGRLRRQQGGQLLILHPDAF